MEESANRSLLYPFLAALLASSFPYVILRYRYGVARVKSSYELLDVVRIMAGQAHLSVPMALNYVTSVVDEKSAIRNPLRNFSNVMINYRDEGELEEAAQEFARSIGTAFSISFVSILMQAQRGGREGLEESMFELESQMEQQRMAILKAKDANKEAISLGTYGNLVVYLLLSGTMLILMKPNIYLNLQFRTTVGLVGFSLVAVLSFASYIAAKMLNRLSLDYH